MELTLFYLWIINKNIGDMNALAHTILSGMMILKFFTLEHIMKKIKECSKDVLQSKKDEQN